MSSRPINRYLLPLALIALVGGLLPLAPSFAQTGSTYSETAAIRGSNPVSPGLTGTRWELDCPNMPPNQGDDGHVFTLPEDLVVDGSTTTTTGASAAAYDLDLFFYAADCALLDSAATNAADETAPTPAGTRYVLVHAFSGSNIQATLTIAPTDTGPSPSPSSTATQSPTPGPTATTSPECGVYPVAPNDELFPRQNAILGGQWGMRTIHAPEAWQEPQATGCGVTVAVLDTGLDLDHPDFQCPGKINVIADSDFIGDGNGPQDGQGHGTHVAGIVGACTNNGEGVVGVAPDASILPIQVLDANGDAPDIRETLPGAIRAATDSGAHVINMSLGTLEVNSPIEILFGEVFPVVEDAVEYAVSKGVVVVAAAGNRSFPLCSYPAIIDDIVCVGSSDNRDLNSYFGNFPVKDDDGQTFGPGLLAPGGSGGSGQGISICDFHAEDIVSTYLVEADNCDDGYDGYKILYGTSMAAPHVAGVAALVYDRLNGVRSAANGQTVVDALIAGADDLYAPGYDPASGYGRLNALKAVREVAVSGQPSPSPTPTPQVQGTAVTFTEAVPTSGQFTDSISLSARLTNESGVPLADEELTFQLLGHDGFRETNARTNADGIATVDLTLDAPPGAYDVIVAYAGKTNTYDSSSDRRPFTILREDSAATLELTGSGSDKALKATLADGDDAGHPVMSVALAFYAEGQFIGEAITNEQGVATLQIPAKYRNKRTVYEVRFGGNSFFLPTSARR